MIKMRSLFSFSQQEVDCAFQHAQTKKYFHGIKLLTSPEACLLGGQHGKILIIIPRSSGKAHDRNLFRRRIKSIFYAEKLFRVQGVWILMAQKRAMSLEFDLLKNFLVSTIGPLPS